MSFFIKCSFFFFNFLKEVPYDSRIIGTSVKCIMVCILFIICFFFRHLTGEITQEWQELEDKDNQRKERLHKLIKDIIPYLMSHNAEAEACDALMETEQLDGLPQYVDESAFPRVCLYLTRY